MIRTTSWLTDPVGDIWPIQHLDLNDLPLGLLRGWPTQRFGLPRVILELSKQGREPGLEKSDPVEERTIKTNTQLFYETIIMFADILFSKECENNSRNAAKHNFFNMMII